jgi:hypothetical protein
MNAIKLGVALLLASALAAPAALADPQRPSFREGKADFHDKELSLTYAFGPGSVDFALTEALSVGVAVDQVINAQDWYYRATYNVVDDVDNGLAIALNGGGIQTRERLAGDIIAPPVWGYQAGVLVSFGTESGLTFRSGFQLYDTQWGAGDGPKFLFTPEIAYRWKLIEVTLQPSFPLDFSNFSWVGIRLRI